MKVATKLVATLGVMVIALSGCTPKVPEAQVTDTIEVRCNIEYLTDSEENTIEVEDGETALEVLTELCEEKDYTLTTEGGEALGYVTEINGLKAGDEGKESGWMYEVNGESPEVGAGQYEIEEGDTINWYYITSYDEIR